MNYIKDQLEKLDELNSILFVLSKSIKTDYIHQYHVNKVLSFLSDNFSETLKVVDERVRLEEKRKMETEAVKYDYKALEEAQSLWVKDYIKMEI